MRLVLTALIVIIIALLFISCASPMAQGDTMAIQPPTVLSGTYSERIAYPTATLLWRTYWYQTDTGVDGATTYPQGYYIWSVGGSTGAWAKSTTIADQNNFTGGIATYGGYLHVRSDDTALIILASGLDVSYKQAGIYFANDNYTRKAAWDISKAGDAESNLNIGRYDDNGSYVDIPFSISRATGAVTVNAPFYAAQKVVISGDTTPAQITADQNDYALSATASVLRLSSDLSRNVTGLTGGEDGRVVVILNVGTQSIVLVDESASSTAANRFALKANITIAADGSATLIYDATSSRWRCVSTY